MATGRKNDESQEVIHLTTWAQGRLYKVWVQSHFFEALLICQVYRDTPGKRNFETLRLEDDRHGKHKQITSQIPNQLHKDCSGIAVWPVWYDAISCDMVRYVFWVGFSSGLSANRGKPPPIHPDPPTPLLASVAAWRPWERPRSTEPRIKAQHSTA